MGFAFPFAFIICSASITSSQGTRVCVCAMLEEGDFVSLCDFIVWQEERHVVEHELNVKRTI